MFYPRVCIRRRAEVNRVLPVLQGIVERYMPCAMKTLPDGYDLRNEAMLLEGTFTPYMHVEMNLLHSDYYDVPESGQYASGRFGECVELKCVAAFRNCFRYCSRRVALVVFLVLVLR